MLFGFALTGEEKGRSAPIFSLFNTLSGVKERFIPLKPPAVSMYNCGPTVYSFQHIGNLRPYVFADILRRTLEYNSFRVTQVVNITDVGHLVSDADTGEDKMEKAAKDTGKNAQSIAKEITEIFFEDLEKLGISVKKITWAKATDHIREQIAFVQTLEEKGYTYKTKDGIYFDTSRFKEYGKLGNINLAGLKEGARVEENPEKLHGADFALWKFSPKRKKREQEWDSPWGMGFPGWHIECSAMAMSHLGKQLDIHTGGIDHIPVHHNNEIAQTESVTGKQFVKYWLHNAFITIEGRKISKSLGNTVLLRQIIESGFSPLAYRYWLLSGHYRSPMNFTWEALEGAEHALKRLHRIFIEELPSHGGEIDTQYEIRFHEAINDDLDTPKALALLWELVKDEKITLANKRATLLAFDRVLGIGFIEGKEKLKEMLSIPVLALKELPEEIRTLVETREEARKNKEWEKADVLRSNLEAQGYSIEDTPNGPQVIRRE